MKTRLKKRQYTLLKHFHILIGWLIRTDKITRLCYQRFISDTRETKIPIIRIKLHFFSVQDFGIFPGLVWNKNTTTDVEQKFSRHHY